jgi:HNH endonuclease
MAKLGTQLQWFFEKVDQRGLDECWNWKAGKNYAGYGVFGNQRAHRWIWEFENGPIPAGMYVLHSCDNPACVNPYHLRLGTHQENMRERDLKGRTLSGENANPAKLTTADVERIREMTLFGANRKDLAHIFAVTPEAIGLVVRRVTHVVGA